MDSYVHSGDVTGLSSRMVDEGKYPWVRGKRNIHLCSSNIERVLWLEFIWPNDCYVSSGEVDGSHFSCMFDVWKTSTDSRKERLFMFLLQYFPLF